MRSEQLYLNDILETGDVIRKFLKGASEADFYKDELRQNAVLYKLTIIGEAASHVSPGLRARHPEIEWSDILGFRNIGIHAFSQSIGILFGLRQPTMSKF